MNSRDFCFWLQGFFEISKCDNNTTKAISAQQVEVIEKHLSLVFKHEIDPAMGDESHQKILNNIHSVKPRC